MRLIVPPLHERINDTDDPFESDSFQRKDFIRSLTRVFKSCDDGLVITIDAEWGAGKTTLLKLWEKYINDDPENDFLPIYYDAFQNDFTDDVFLSIAVKIHEAFCHLREEQGGDPQSDEQLKRLKKATVDLAKNTIRITTKGAVSKLLGDDAPKELVNAGKSAVDTLYDTLEIDAEKKFEAHLQSMYLIESYQKQLKVLAKGGGGNEPRKVVFFVDELDRCRPDFAVQVIEKIKHLFNIDCVYFVLAANCKQLLSVISKSYGIEKEDAAVYLEKFVNFETRLPLLKDVVDESAHFYLSDLIKESGLGSLYYLTTETYDLLVNFLQLMNVNQRSLERVVSYICLVVIHSEEVVFTDEYFVVLFYSSVIKVKGLSIIEGFERGVVSGLGKKGVDAAAYEWGEKYFRDYSYYRLGNQAKSFQMTILKDLYSCLEMYSLKDALPYNER